MKFPAKITLDVMLDTEKPAALKTATKEFFKLLDIKNCNVHVPKMDSDEQVKAVQLT